MFVTRRDLTATNNGSERAIRPCTVYRKVTNGFRSEWAARLYANIRSAVEEFDEEVKSAEFPTSEESYV